MFDYLEEACKKFNCDFIIFDPMPIFYLLNPAAF